MRYAEFNSGVECVHHCPECGWPLAVPIIKCRGGRCPNPKCNYKPGSQDRPGEDRWLKQRLRYWKRVAREIGVPESEVNKWAEDLVNKELASQDAASESVAKGTWLMNPVTFLA